MEYFLQDDPRAGSFGASAVRVACGWTRADDLFMTITAVPAVLTSQGAAFSGDPRADKRTGVELGEGQVFVAAHQPDDTL